MHHADNAFARLLRLVAENVPRSRNKRKKRKKQPVNKHKAELTDYENNILSIFQGNLRSVNRCQECETEKETCQMFLGIRVPLSEEIVVKGKF